jgi:hypothetical protein
MASFRVALIEIYYWNSLGKHLTKSAFRNCPEDGIHLLAINKEHLHRDAHNLAFRCHLGILIHIGFAEL